MAMQHLQSGRRRRLHADLLETRVVPVTDFLLINEIHFDPLFGDASEDQYLEFRGTPGENVGPDTYLVVVDGDANDAGVINSVFALSNLQLGSNGFLVLTQAGGNYPSDDAASVFQGTDGFAGLPGDLFSDNSTLSNRFEFIFGANTFLLIETGTAPVAGDDVDSNNDGNLDGPASSWNILDSVSVLGTFTGGNATEIAYSQLVFAADGLGQFPSNSEVIRIGDASYVGRIGDSTGSRATDWVGGITQETTTDQFDFRLTAGLTGNPAPRFLSGRALDHVGASNFVTAIQGTVFEDSNANQMLEPDEPGLGNVQVYLDRNGNSQPDSFESEVEPDTLSAGTELTNAFNGVTLTEADETNEVSGTSVSASDAADNASTGQQIFGRGGTNWFDNNSRLRIDFYNPVEAIQIDYSQPSMIDTGFGQLEIFNAQGQSLGSITSAAIQGDTTTLSINRPQADIAYAVAHSTDAGTPFGFFDNLVYIQPEESVLSAADGSYRLDFLQPGTYTVRQVVPVGSSVSVPSSGFYTAEIVGTTPVQELDFGNTPGGTVPPPPGVPPGVPPVPPPGVPPSPPGVPPVGGSLPSVPNAEDSSALPFFAVGAGAGGSDEVTVFDLSGTPLLTAPAFTETVTALGGVRVATADVTGDGIPDIVTAAGPGQGPVVNVLDGRNGSVVRTLQAFEIGFTGGVFVALGDVNNDGAADIVLTPDQGGGPRVRIFSGSTGIQLADFFGIDDPTFRGGARAAVGDMNGDDAADVVISAGFGGGPRVAGYDGLRLTSGSIFRLFADFFIFEPGLRNGAYVTLGDVTGDGLDDLLAGAGPGGGPRIFGLNGSQLVTSFGASQVPVVNFFVDNVDSRLGVRLTAKSLDQDTLADLVIGRADAPEVFIYRGSDLSPQSSPAIAQMITPFDLPFSGGVFVG